MLGTIIESKDQHFVGLDAYGVNQFTPAFWGVFCLFDYTAQKLLKSTLDVALVPLTSSFGNQNGTSSEEAYSPNISRWTESWR